MRFFLVFIMAISSLSAYQSNRPDFENFMEPLQTRAGSLKVAEMNANVQSSIHYPNIVKKFLNYQGIVPLISFIAKGSPNGLKLGEKGFIQANSNSQLEQLNKQVKKELQLLDYPPAHWLKRKTTSNGTIIYNVLIIGGGQTGQTLAFALQKEKVGDVIVFDENEEGFEGPWLKYARMEHLRTPKYTLGPDCDVPSLTCQSWFEAKYGTEEWNKFNYIPLEIWTEYLKWFREILNLPVFNQTKVEAFHWDEKERCFVVPIKSPNGDDIIYAKKIILATGLQGSGEWTNGSYLFNQKPNNHCISVYEPIDFEKLKGKKIAILGGGPCAFDNAIQCHKHGAQEIHLFFKRAQLVNLHVFRWGEYVGFLRHFPDLSDQDKWNFIAKMYEIGQPPIAETVAKVRAMDNVVMHYDSPWLNYEIIENKAVVHTPKGNFAFDQMLLATGWVADLSLRNELENFSHEIALWSDRFVPPAHQLYHGLLRMPYLGPHFEFTEKNPGQAPYLHSIFNCTGGALLSTGFSAGTGLTGMKYSIQKLVYGVVSQLFLDEKDQFYHTLETYDEVLFEN